jgi:ketosteroid isomerase-like protein
MSLENVEVVRRFLLLEVDEALTHADPEIVWNPAEESATQGHDAVRASLVRWKREWDDYELLPEEFEHMGNRVVAAVRLRGRGRGSGIAVDARFYEVYTLRQGKIVRMDQFTQRAEALEAVGLRENTDVVRLTYAALGEDDVDALATLTDPGWVFDFSRSIGPDAGVYQGRDEIVRFATAMGEAFERFQLLPVDFSVGPAGQIVVRHRVRAKGLGSGLEWERIPDATLLWELRDGKVIKTTLYQHRGEALEAAGLAE